VRDNGEEVMAKLMRVGDSYVVEGNTRLYLSTGNAGGLEIVIGNDDPRSIGETGRLSVICRWLSINYGRRSSHLPRPSFAHLDMIVSRYFGANPDFDFSHDFDVFHRDFAICAAISGQNLRPASHLGQLIAITPSKQSDALIWRLPAEQGIEWRNLQHGCAAHILEMQ
jgi:hypothetical protein